jgi:hypothetical protein
MVNSVNSPNILSTAIEPPCCCVTISQLLDDVRNIVGIGRDRVWSRRPAAFAVPAEVYGDDAMPPGEVFSLRGKERAIAGRPVHKDKGGFPGATIFKSQFDAVTNNRRHDYFSLLRRAVGATTSRLLRL